MDSTHHRLAWVWVALFVTCGSAHADGKLGVTDAWIHPAPPGATMLAGYATLSNNGDAPLTVLAVQSQEFRTASLHETTVEGDVSRMRKLHRLVIEPGTTVAMQPGGKHLMLMHPRHPIAVGEKIGMTFLLNDGTRVETYFDVIAADSAAD